MSSRPAERSHHARGPAPRGFTLIASGDVLTHGAVLEQASAYGRRVNQPYDFRPMFADLRPIVSRADLAVCHLEVPLSRSGQDISGLAGVQRPAATGQRTPARVPSPSAPDASASPVGP